MVDRWSSTDGRPHRLDLRLYQAACLSVGDDCSEQIAYRFPGESAYARHDANDATPRTGVVPGPFESRQPIFTRDATEALRGGGAIVPEQRADRARFLDDDAFVLEYDALTIPAGGELMLIHHYVTASDAAEVEPLTAALIAGLPQPAPASGGKAAPAEHGRLVAGRPAARPERPGARAARGPDLRRDHRRPRPLRRGLRRAGAHVVGRPQRRVVATADRRRSQRARPRPAERAGRAAAQASRPAAPDRRGVRAFRERRAGHPAALGHGQDRNELNSRASG